MAEPVKVVVRPYGIHNFERSVADFDVRRVTGAPIDAPVIIDLSGVTFVRPSMLVLLRAFAELMLRGDASRGIAARRLLIHAPKSRSVRNYLLGMNLFGPGQGPQPLLPEAANAHHLPLRALTTSDETEYIAGHLKKIVIDTLRGHAAAEDLQRIGAAIGTTLGELLENFRKHSESERRGFACAQFYPPGVYRDEGRGRRFRRGMVDIAVADTGIGIRRSLGAVPSLARRMREGANPCELATRFGVTSKPGEHGGYGLWVSRRLCERSAGAFKLASGGSTFASSRRGSGKSGGLPRSLEWPGTFVAMRLTLSGGLDVARIYDELPPHPLLQE